MLKLLHVNPNNNQQVSADYLDQISIKSNNVKLFSDKKFLFVAIGGALTVIVAIIIIIAGMTQKSNDIVQLAARLNSVNSTVDTTKNKIKSSDLRATNSELKIYLTNTIRDLGTILSAKNIKIDKLESKYTKLESNEDLLLRLEDARLNAVYDRIYAREMATWLEKTLIMMQDSYDLTPKNNTKTRDFLNNAYSNLDPLQSAFENFNN